jgi:hypothetical protein
MVSIERCRELIGEWANGKSDEEIEGIRDSLMELASIALAIAEEKFVKKRSTEPLSN